MQLSLQLDTATLHVEDVLLLVLLELGSHALTWAACGREPLAAPLHNPWVLCPEHHSVHCTVFAALHVRSVPSVSSAGFLLHIGRDHPCSFYNQEGIYCFTFIALRKQIFVLFHYKSHSWTGVKYDLNLYSGRAQNHSSRFVIIPFRKQGLRRSGRTQLWIMFPRLKCYSQEWGSVG